MQAILIKELQSPGRDGFFRSQDKKLVLPVSCYLIQHPRVKCYNKVVTGVANEL